MEEQDPRPEGGGCAYLQCHVIRAGGKEVALGVPFDGVDFVLKHTHVHTNTFTFHSYHEDVPLLEFVHLAFTRMP